MLRVQQIRKRIQLGDAPWDIAESFDIVVIDFTLPEMTRIGDYFTPDFSN